MAIKIDFEKTYDRVWWDFLEGSLGDEGIPHYLSPMIMQ